MDIIVRDVELVALVLILSFFVHFLGRSAYSQMVEASKQQKAARPKKKPRPASTEEAPLIPAPAPRDRRPSDAPAAEAAAAPARDRPAAPQEVQKRLSAATTAAELFGLCEAEIDNFTISNLAFAIYRAGKMQVPPSEAFSMLLVAVRPAVPRLKPRGAAHVLWAIARVRPGGAEDLVGALVAALAPRLGELDAVDQTCCLWAASEFVDHFEKMLSACEAVDFDSFSTTELVSLLGTLAGAVSAAPATEPFRRATDRAARLVAARLPSKDVVDADLIKFTRAVVVFQAKRVTSEEVLSAAFAALNAELKMWRKGSERFEVLVCIPEEKLDRATLEAIALHAMKKHFKGYDTPQLIKLAGLLDGRTLDLGEFWIELAEKFNAIELSSGQKEELRAVVERVGLPELFAL